MSRLRTAYRQAWKTAEEMVGGLVLGPSRLSRYFSAAHSIPVRDSQENGGKVKPFAVVLGAFLLGCICGGSYFAARPLRQAEQIRAEAKAELDAARQTAADLRETQRISQRQAAWLESVTAREKGNLEERAMMQAAARVEFEREHGR